MLSAYAHGRRQPSVAALARIARGGWAGARDLRSPTRDALDASGRILIEVLDLAGSMPLEADAASSTYPPLIRLRVDERARPNRMLAVHDALEPPASRTRSAARSRSGTARSSRAARATSTSMCSSTAESRREKSSPRCRRESEVTGKRSRTGRTRRAGTPRCGTRHRSTCSSVFCRSMTTSSATSGRCRSRAAQSRSRLHGTRRLQGDVRPPARLGRHRSDGRGALVRCRRGDRAGSARWSETTSVSRS